MLRAAALVCLLSSCQFGTVAPIPEPLPETLAWATERAPETGAWLGVEVRENDSGSLDELFFDPGAHVTEVHPGSPAARAGVAVDDVLLAFGETPVNDPDALAAMLADAKPGTEVTLEVRRGDTVFGVPVVLGDAEGHEAGEAEVLYRVEPSRSRAGWIEGHGGVVMVTSDEDGPFLEAGIQVGSVVLSIERDPVRSARELARRLLTYDPGESVRIEYLPPPEEGGALADEPEVTWVRLQKEPRRTTEALIPILFNYTSDVDGSRYDWALVDLWFIALLEHEVDGSESTWKFLRFFKISSGVGELEE